MSTISMSTYSAPNTPIASVKRPRRSSSMLKKDNDISSPPPRNARNISDDSSDIMSTPSKILFSPSLRNGAHKKFEPLRRPSLPVKQNEEEEEEFNPYLFMSQLPNHAEVSIPGKICLPPMKPDMAHLPTLVLDLDETLVHCTVEAIPDADLQFPVMFNNTLYQVYVKKRPHLDEFLDTVAKHFEVVVFTASQRIYADSLLDLLDPEKKYIHHRLFREACLLVQGNFLKDLAVLGRDLKKTIIIDNSPYAYGYQISNGIPIESFFDDDQDEELLKVMNFLSEIHLLDDIRPSIESHFGTHELIDQCKRL